MGPKKSRGFTLLEMLAVIAIMGLLAVVVVDPIVTFRNNQQVTSAAEEVLELFTEARTKTLSSYDGARWGVHLATDRAALYKTAYATSAPDTRAVIFPGTVEIDEITLAGNATDVLFDRLTGKTAQIGTFRVRLSATTTLSRTITILSTGNVSISQ